MRVGGLPTGGINHRGGDVIGPARGEKRPGNQAGRCTHTAFTAAEQGRVVQKVETVETRTTDGRARLTAAARTAIKGASTSASLRFQPELPARPKGGREAPFPFLPGAAAAPVHSALRFWRFEPSIKPVRHRDQQRRRQHPRGHVHDVVIPAVNRGDAKQHG